MQNITESTLSSIDTEKKQSRVPPEQGEAKAHGPIRRVVEGRNVPLPKNWPNFLSLADNKADLAHFLSEQLYLQAPIDKEILVAGGFRDELMVKSSQI